MVREFIEKMLVLVGQCKKYNHIRKVKECISWYHRDIENTSSTAMLKEKVSFLQKPSKSFFGKEFTENLAESNRIEKQEIDVTKNVSRPKRQQPF